MLAGMSNYEEYLRIDEKDTAPSIAQLRIALYPDWEGIVDGHIQSMANRMSPKVGVPDFAYLAASMPHTHTLNRETPWGTKYCSTCAKLGGAQ